MKKILSYFALMTASSLSYSDTFYRGADLSYVNELEDCGAVFYENKKAVDPFLLFSQKGANLIRVRLWHNPTWTNYSHFDDVVKTLKRAKAVNVDVLLDIHYSDDWADPERQEIPKAWETLSQSDLEKATYDYTTQVLDKLKQLDLVPPMIQVGNETNIEIMQPIGKTQTETINWPRNAALLNQGIKAVRDFSSREQTPIEIVIHIAQPENALKWFPAATQAGVTDYDTIGLSYYSKWSTQSQAELATSIKTLKQDYKKEVMVVETAYPWTLKNNDKAPNLFEKNGLAKGYKLSPQGQLDYLNTLAKTVKQAGGKGVIYWEPAWVSTQCVTRWGKGSHWDNTTLFDHKNRALIGMDFFNSPL